MTLLVSPQEAAAELLKRRAARKTFTSFCEYVAPEEPPAEHHRLLCDAVDKVIDGEIRNLMVFMPPGSAKSTYGSVRAPAYFLGKLKKKNIICASYGDDFAASFGRKVRNLVSSKECRNVFPDLSLAQDSQARGEWETQDGGTYFAVGVGGGVTGRRADLGIIDDPVKGRKDADSVVIKEFTWGWYLSDFLTRLKPGAAQIIIQTRWVCDDISGRILPESWNGESGEFEGSEGKTWTVICLQAQAEEGKNDPLGRKPGEWLWLDWFNKEFWEETKLTQQKTDARNWSALYQQSPTPEDGIYFKSEWWRTYKDRPRNLNIYITHDDAVTEDGGDFTEIAVWGVDADEKLYAIDWWSGRKTSDVWVDAIIDFILYYNPFAVVGEAGVIRKSVEPFLEKRMLQRSAHCRVEWLPTIGDKPARARTFQAMMSMGLVYFPETEWAEAVKSQLLRFLVSTVDDKVDACGLIGRAINQTWAALPPKPEEDERDITAAPTLDELLNNRKRRRVKTARI